MKCIVKDLRNHLVIAGAGTGKTTTIVGRVKYLLNTNACKLKDRDGYIYFSVKGLIYLHLG